jgi:hypothetical protein
LLPFIAVISAGSLNLLVENSGRYKKAVYGVIVVYLIVLIVLGPSRHNSQFTLKDQLQLAGEVGEMLDDDETVYAIGCTHLLAFNDAENWLKCGYFFRGFDKYLADKSGNEIFMPVKGGAMPSVILLARRSPRGSEKWLDTLYTDVTPPEFKKQKIQVFKLKKRFENRHWESQTG